MGKPLIIKLGGVILDSPEALSQLFTAVGKYRHQQLRPIVLMHGGGCLVDKILGRLGLAVCKINGLRVTPADQIEIVTGALAGTANKLLLSFAKRYSLNAVGLSIGDSFLTEVVELDPELGHVGEVSAGNPDLLKLLLTAGYLPIISSIGISAEGQLMNVNADQAAAAIASSLGADLLLLSDVAGVLDANQCLLPELGPETAAKLVSSGVITAGMQIKVNAALEVAKLLKQPVNIASWRDIADLNEWCTHKMPGTRIWA